MYLILFIYIIQSYECIHYILTLRSATDNYRASSSSIFLLSKSFQMWCSIPIVFQQISLYPPQNKRGSGLALFDFLSPTKRRLWIQFDENIIFFRIEEQNQCMLAWVTLNCLITSNIFLPNARSSGTSDVIKTGNISPVICTILCQSDVI